MTITINASISKRVCLCVVCVERLYYLLGASQTSWPRQRRTQLCVWLVSDSMCYGHIFTI